MKEPKNLWEIWNLAKAYNTRPSSLLNLSDPIQAYRLDRATMHFGSALEKALDDATKQGKRKKPMSEAMKNQKTAEVLRRWLGEGAAEKKYKDPMVRLKAEGNRA